jgi:predicted branched-subunit amino acid permease
MTDRSDRAPFVVGVLEQAPILIGVVPFGVIAGIVAVEAGLSPLQAYSLSPIVFAGASQLAMIGLIARDAAPLVIVGTALVINARMAMYSAALAPSFRLLSPLRKAGAAYLLTDQAFALSVLRYESLDEPLGARFAYYMGAALTLWVTWQTASIIGVLVGTGVPDSWSLDFAIPLVFMALLFPAITDRATTIAAAVAAAAAVATVTLPLNVGLLIAVALGLIAGALGGRS